MTYNLVMPTTLDALHLILGGVAALLLLITIILASRRKPESAPVPAAPAAPAPIAAPAANPAPVIRREEPQPTLRDNGSDSALQLLSALQHEGRFIDFLQEDLKAFGDAEVGAVARVLHEGCNKVMRQYFTLTPIRDEQEESRVTLPSGFNPAENRVTGNVTGEPPFTGTLIHRGWRVEKVELPKVSGTHDTRIVAPAEVEL